MAFLYKTVGSYTLNVNVDDLGYSKPVLVYTNDGIEAISHELSGDEGSIAVCNSLILNEQLEKITNLFEVFPKIVSVNAVNNCTTTTISTGDITPVPTIVECKSNVSDVLANGSISSYGSSDTAKNTFTTSSTGNTIGEALNSARKASAKKAATFLLPDEKLGDGDIVSNSTNTFYATVSYNNVVEPGEKWVLAQEKLPEEVGLPSVAIGDTSEHQYFTNTNSIYKLINNDWKELFSLDFSGKFDVICTSGNGQYVSAGVGVSNSTHGAIYYSNDFGLTWSSKFSLDYDNARLSSLIMSKDGKVLTTVVDNFVTVSNDLYYSLDFGETWELSQGNNDPNSPIVYITMNAPGTVQYATSGSSWIGGTGPNNGVWLSTDFGVTWEKIFTLDNVTFQTICTNSDGSVVAVSVTEVDGKSSLYYSTDFGTTWTMSNTPDVTIGPSYMSSSGEYQTLTYTSRLYGGQPGTLYSVDYGATWKESDITTVSSEYETRDFTVAMDSSANYQIAATERFSPSLGYQIYVSEILL